MSEGVRFEFAGISGEVTASVAGAAATPAELEAAIRRAIDPAHAVRSLYWGRNYLYATTFELGGSGGNGGAGDPGGDRRTIAVKQFRHDRLRDRFRRWRKGSNAERSFRAALAVDAAGVATPEPFFFCEDSIRRAGAAHYACAALEGGVELRYFLRARNEHREAEAFPDIDPRRLLEGLAEQARRLHRAAIWHRDWTSGNVWVTPSASGELRLELLDLNRARIGQPLTADECLRELSRMPIHRAEDQAVLLDAYFGRPVTPREVSRYRALHGAFLAKHRWKKRLRFWRRDDVRGGGLLTKRTAHPHIPPAREGAGAREQVVWDSLSDQPHQHAGRAAKLGARLADLPAQGRDFARALAAWPAVRRRERELRIAPVAEFEWPGLSVGLRPDGAHPNGPDDPAPILALLAASGLRRASLRLHPWQERHDAEEILARALHEAGFDLAFTLPQNRELVLDPRRWDAAIEELAERFGKFGSTFQVGQAINRSKWGVWSIGEYARLAESACATLAARGLRSAGPAVIDFEFHWTAAVLNSRHDFSFDVISALLYVDRRGAPENSQAGYDTAGKVRLLRAISERAPRVRLAERTPSLGSEGERPPLWISEVNWPLREGPHSPAGKAVSVDEETQADYLTRYAVVAFASGCVDRIDWWQLQAPGYGLVDPRVTPARRRPAFEALARLEDELRGRRFVGREPTADEVYAYRWRAGARASGDRADDRADDLDDLVIAWSTTSDQKLGGHRLSGRPVYLRGAVLDG